MDKFKDAKTMALDKFHPHSLCSWTQFNCNLQNYLASIWGIARVPLSYVIWKEEFLDMAPPEEDGVEELIHPCMEHLILKIRKGCTAS